LDPQHRIVPSAISAHECADPALIATASAIPSTVTETRDASPIAARPS
jgi:hypothetical protein